MQDKLNKYYMAEKPRMMKMKTGIKKLKDHTLKELYDYIDDNENKDGGLLGCICSEILRRQNNNADELEDLQTLMKGAYSGFAHWETDFQLEAFEDYLSYYKKYVLLTIGDNEDE